jgi:hypothetical protein
MYHLGAEYFGAEDQPLQFRFKTPFGALSTPEYGRVHSTPPYSYRLLSCAG